MIQKVQNSCQFHGLPGDDANKHLDKFLHVTQSIKVNGVTDDALRLYLFPHSLTHHATTWFDRLPRNSINTFEQMAKMFLEKYFPPSMVTKLRNKITNFHQRLDESLFEAWERYKLSIDLCPNHNMLLPPLAKLRTYMLREPIKGASHGQNPPPVYQAPSYQAPGYQAPVHQPSISQPQVVTTNEFTNFRKAKDAIFKNMQTNMISLTNSNLDHKNMFGQFMKMNTASSLGSRTLPCNIITNPKEDLKGITIRIGTAYQGPTIPTTSSSLPLVVERETEGITTRSGTAYQGPTIPTTSSSSPKVVERGTEVTKDTVPPTNNGSTKDVQPPVVQIETPKPNSEPVVAPVVAPITIQRRSHVDPTLLNDFKMATDGNGDPTVPYLYNMEELCQPSLNGRGGPIAPIAIQATNFRLKYDMIQQVQNSYQFHGLLGDDANKHLDKFLHVTQSIKVNGVIDDALRLWNLYERRLDECYDLIENMTAHHNDWDYLTQRSELSSSITFSSDSKIVALKAKMAEINKNLIKVLQIIQQVKAVTPICKTCGGPYSYNDCPATVGQTHNVYEAEAYNQGGNSYQPQGASHGPNPPPAYQAPGYQALVHQPLIPQPQVMPTTEFTNYMKVKDAFLKNMQTNMTSLTNSNLELKNMFGQFMKMNIASSSGLGTLPSNTVTNPKVDLKGITTQSGTAYQGPTIPTTYSSLPQVVERKTEGVDKLPVIIAKDLKNEEKTTLIKVLKSHKRAIAWKLFDIKGINPEFCTHNILIEDDFKPAIQHQRRVNPKIYDVIKKEVEKLLDTGLIYPISDSPWNFLKYLTAMAYSSSFAYSSSSLPEVEQSSSLDYFLAFKAINFLSTFAVTISESFLMIISTRPKARGVVMQEPSETPTTTTTIPISSKVQDKGKGIMVEEPLKMKKKDQISFDEQEAKRLQDDGDDVTINATPLSIKTPIIDYKIYKEGKKSYFQIFNADGNSQMYYTFSKILKNFDRLDLEVLWRLVKDRFIKSKPVDDMDSFLLHTLKSMFEHHVEDN
nr:reverse transcriptase domain-containing protein [Tanacetum cinerariifolium]